MRCVRLPLAAGIVLLQLVVTASPVFLTGDAAGRYVENLERRATAMRRSVCESRSDWSGATGTVYYISAEGDDARDGRSERTALRTLEAVGKLPVKPGDAVLFRRGDLFRGRIEARDGVTYSAYGRGEKPTICASRRNYADPALWQRTEFTNVWLCTTKVWNAGIVAFDHNPQKVGAMNAKVGRLRCNWSSVKTPHHLVDDLDFWCELSTSRLYLRSEAGNPGTRFKRIEIGCRGDAIRICGDGVTVDNLHVTLTGSHGVGAGTVRNLEVRNCIFDWLGGSLLIPEGEKGGPSLYGNAVEVYGGCDGFRIRGCWIYQIYDTGITHQCHNDQNRDIYQFNVEYADNLIERCFWSIEYYNSYNRHSETRNVHVHDNFCRYGGWGWGCRGREQSTPMLTFGDKADFTENYVNERNVLQYSRGALIWNWGSPASPPGFIFQKNVYVQPRGWNFMKIGDRNPKVVKFDGSAAGAVHELYGETDGTFVFAEKDLK